MARRLCAISIDLDEVHHYYAIHGLTPARDAAHAVYERGVRRFGDFATGLRLPLTFFVVGADVERAENAALLRAMSERGHELGNHTFDHHYDLTRRSDADIRDQIERANDIMGERAGQRPTGFRAPGYTMSDGVYRALVASGMAYSSSVFPCPWYYAAKAAIIGAYRLRGKTSSSIVGSPRVLSAPRVPYRAGEPYFREGAGLIELPIQVTPRLRLPFIGTSLTGLGPLWTRRLAQSLVGQELVNLELHGVDLLDAQDGLDALAPHQVDLRVPLGTKWDVLSEVVRVFREAGYAFVRLGEAARAFSAHAR
ncbi:MAG TPA: polysaccharide deacetylase family protein [Polyangiaceae bacterium]|nr:polysaccharide deacetylase family protein [Polyangiaceae bacterium]